MLNRFFSFLFCFVVLTSSYVCSTNLVFNDFGSEKIEETLTPDYTVGFIDRSTLFVVTPWTGERVITNFIKIQERLETSNFQFFSTDLAPPSFYS